MGRDRSCFWRGSSSGWSGCWREIVKIISGVERVWFEENFERVLRNKKDTLFWEGIWVENESLQSKFLRLCHLSRDKEGKVGDMGFWEGNVWHWRWRWRRVLRERDLESFNILLSLINRSILKDEEEDSWRWSSFQSGRYRTNEAYHILVEIEGVANLIQNSSRPSCWD